MEPLSNVLSSIDTRDVVCGRLSAGQGWCIHSPAYLGLRFGVVTQGHCWLQVDGMELPTRLGTGDCYLLTDGRSYRLGDDLAMPPLAMDEVMGQVVAGQVQIGPTKDMQLIGGRFSIQGAQASFLVECLPSIIHIEAVTDPAGKLRWVLAALADEHKEGQAGSASMVEHLAHVMLIHIVRLYLLVAHGQGLRGWLAALADPRIGAALALMHGEPARRWGLAEIANAVGMSRSAFALRFRSQVGTTPLGYLLAWRMRLAAQALLTRDVTISSIALNLGYESEGAFSSAFKRAMGCAPRTYRQRSRQPSGQ